MIEHARRHVLSLIALLAFGALAAGSIDSGSSSYKPPTREDQAKKQQEEREEQAKRLADEREANDAVVLERLNNGSLKDSIFQRTGPWRASLCVMSDESGFLGYRDGGVALRVWQKKRSGWEPTDYYDTSGGGVIAPGKMKCADVGVPTGGTFFLDQSIPRGVNAVLSVDGGGRRLRSR